MGQTECYKILSSHLVSGELRQGESISIRIDQTLTQDATGTMAYLEFEALGLDRVRNELAVSYVDHNTVQVGFENADDHEYLRTVADRKGVIYSRAGNGICHQVHLERFARPGKTLLGSDSHTPTAGGIASFAAGAGGLDVALAMAGVPFSIIAPRVVEIRLHGHLRPFVSAKDVILCVLERFGVKGNVNTVFEYTGEGVNTLSVPERATIANMGAECGVTTSLFPSDGNTKAFLEAQGRGDEYIPLYPDEDAVYDDLFEIDLSSLEPLAACPHSPGNIAKVSDLAGMRINQVLIGSCTNSSYMDLKKAGFIDKLPEVIAVQSTKSDAIARALESGIYAPISASTIADSISVDMPAAGRMAVSYIRKTGGRAVCVSDQEIIDAEFMLAKGGIFSEPASSASYAGFLKDRDRIEKKYGKDVSAVILITGTAFKDMKVFDNKVKLPEPIENSIEALDKLNF